MNLDRVLELAHLERFDLEAGLSNREIEQLDHAIQDIYEDGYDEGYDDGYDDGKHVERQNERLARAGLPLPSAEFADL